jgi:hypothetical protein
MANEVVGTHIMIESMVYHKIMHWVNKSSYEVSGLGKITYKDGRITVIDAILLPQKNGSAHTDIEGADVGKAMFLLKDTPGDLRWWWHSHVNMDVFWSGTDRDTIDKITQGGWFVSTVFNKRHEMRSALSMVSPLPLGFIDNIPTQQIQYLDPEAVKKWDDDYEKNVTNLMRTYTWGKSESRYPSESGRSSSDFRSGEGGQLPLLPHHPSRTVEDDGPGIEDRIPPMTPEEIQEYLEERRTIGAPKAGPPMRNGHSGGW